MNPPFGVKLFGSTSGFEKSSFSTNGTDSTSKSMFNLPKPDKPLFAMPSLSPIVNQPQQTAFGSSLFGASSFGQQPKVQECQSGTVIAFNPVPSTDSIPKDGSVSTIKTKHHCITCMKEYELRSLEELRFEDYLANRKGRQQPNYNFETPSQPFAKPTTPAPSLFNNETKTNTFMAPAMTNLSFPAFGSQPTKSHMDLDMPTLLGYNASTSIANTFGFTNTTTPPSNLFGNTSSINSFAAPSLATKPPTKPFMDGFGSTQFFGQKPVQPPPTNLFIKPADKPTFPTPTSNIFNFGQAASSPSPISNIFSPKKSNTGLNLPSIGNISAACEQPKLPMFSGFNNSAKTSLEKPMGPQFTFGSPLEQLKPPTFTNFNFTPTSIEKPLGSPITFKSSFPISSYETTTPKLNLLEPPQLFGGINNSTQKPFPNQFQPESSLPVPTINCDFQQICNASVPYGFSPHLFGLRSIKCPCKEECTLQANPKKDKLLKPQKYVYFKRPTKVEHVPRRLKHLRSPVMRDLFDACADTDFDLLHFKRHAKKLVLPKSKPDCIEKPLIMGYSDRLRTDFKEPPVKSIGYSTSTDTDESSDSESSLKTEPEIETCGIICTRPEYYTLPSIYDVAKFRNEDGTCFVKGFTIGRFQYGNVHFQDVIDVSNLNIDEIVRIGPRELTVYPDDSKKPPVGEGLNRCAQITLDFVYPQKENSNDVETDPEKISAMNYADALRAVCLKHDTTFVDYRPETGSWIFKVNHFSKYGLSDSDDDEIAENLKRKRKELQAKKQSVDSVSEIIFFTNDIDSEDDDEIVGNRVSFKEHPELAYGGNRKRKDNGLKKQTIIQPVLEVGVDLPLDNKYVNDICRKQQHGEKS